MSLYCSGKGIYQANAGFIRWEVTCERKEQCLRYESFLEYKGDPSHTGPATGLWLVNVSNCVYHRFCDGVFTGAKSK